MEPIEIAFLQGIIVGLIPMFITGIFYLAWRRGIKVSEQNEIRRLQRKALERLAGEV